MSVTLPNTQKTYTDTFAFTSGQAYLYQLYDTNTSPATLLAQEQVLPYQSNTTEDQTVDSRWDPRYSNIQYLDFQFGSGIYRGGLFAGYIYSGGAPTDTPPPDSSRIARNFAKFPLSSSPTGATFRTGGIAAYLTGCNTDEGDVNGLQIGCQPLSSNSWVGATLTWDSAPSVTPGNATSIVNISYSASNPTPGWCFWPMPDTIKSTINGSQLLSVAWASLTEGQTGWAYFAKLEYDSTLSPCGVYAYELPSPTSLTFSPNPIPWTPGFTQYQSTGSVTVNGLGPGDAPVTVYVYQDGNPNPCATLTVSSLNNPATFTATISDPSGYDNISSSFKAICNNASITTVLKVQ